MSPSLLDKLMPHRLASPDFKRLYAKLMAHRGTIVHGFHETHAHAKKLLKKHQVNLHHLKTAGGKAAAGAAVAGSLFIAPALSHPPLNSANAPNSSAKAQIPAPSPISSVVGPKNPTHIQLTQSQFGDKIQEIMKNPARQGTLSDAQFNDLHDLIKDQFGIDISRATADGFTLKDEYGFMGAEQHLPTHPGDKAANHVNPNDELAILTGITPGRGAYGYAPAGMEEQWYVVGQTFLSPQFGTAATKNLAGQRYLVIEMPSAANGFNSTVILGDLRDSGPGRSTPKVFGGSPEMFTHFGAQAGSSRKVQTIMLPVNGDIPSSQLGPKGL